MNLYQLPHPHEVLLRHHFFGKVQEPRRSAATPTGVSVESPPQRRQGFSRRNVFRFLGLLTSSSSSCVLTSPSFFFKEVINNKELTKNCVAPTLLVCPNPQQHLVAQLLRQRPSFNLQTSYHLSAFKNSWKTAQTIQHKATSQHPLSTKKTQPKARPVVGSPGSRDVWLRK